MLSISHVQVVARQAKNAQSTRHEVLFKVPSWVSASRWVRVDLSIRRHLGRTAARKVRQWVWKFLQKKRHIVRFIS